jgi:AcrR family transcriptional regulator
MAAQLKKEEVRVRIEEAALRVFAENGFRSSTMADIAREAGVSTGNIYRYYANKDALFYSVVSPDFVDRFRDRIGMKMKTADGVDLREVQSYRPMQIQDEAAKSFFAENRLSIVILLNRAAGTRYEGFRRELVDFTAENALRYLKTMTGRDLLLSKTKRWLLGLIYDNMYEAIAGILTRYEDRDEIAAAYDTFFEYHYQGIAKFLS